MALTGRLQFLITIRKQADNNYFIVKENDDGEVTDVAIGQDLATVLATFATYIGVNTDAAVLRKISAQVTKNVEAL